MNMFCLWDFDNTSNTAATTFISFSTLKVLKGKIQSQHQLLPDDENWHGWIYVLAAGPHKPLQERKKKVHHAKLLQVLIQEETVYLHIIIL